MADFTRDGTINLIHGDPRLACLWRVINNHCADDLSHDKEHVLRVAAWTCCILAHECSDASSSTFSKAIGAALLHDLVNVPKNHSARTVASSLSADWARDLFDRVGFTREESADMAVAIRTHSFSRDEKPRSLLGQALQDADRLDALGAIGIFRCIAVAAQIGARFFHPEDPWAMHRPLDDQAFAVDHFFTKLFLLPGKMNTMAGKAEAEIRVSAMRGFLATLKREIDPFQIASGCPEWISMR